MENNRNKDDDNKNSDNYETDGKQTDKERTDNFQNEDAITTDKEDIDINILEDSKETDKYGIIDSGLISKEINIQLNKVYKIEELITQKRPYYPVNMLFLYQSDKFMNISLESELERKTNESNMTNIKEYMDFCLLIRDEYQEINEEQNLTKKWFTGYISLFNLTINNGTHDISLNYNEELNKIINSNDNTNNRRNLRNLEEKTDNLNLNNKSELCFVKINFYENGEIKDIFYPEEFDLDNMIYIKKITELIIPKLSKKLYTENIKEEIERIEKLLEENYEEEENFINEEETDFGKDLENSDENFDSEELFLEEENDEIYLRRMSENDTDDSSFINDINDISDLSDISDIINKNDTNDDFFYEPLSDNDLEIENINSSSYDDSIKYNLKGIEENETYSTITDYQTECLESDKAKLEGSRIKRIKNTFLDEKGMLIYIIESESISIIQPNKESLNDLTEEEEKLKSEIFNDNNYIPRNDNEDFIGKNISFNISGIKLKNYNNISLYNSINNSELVIKIFNYFDNFDYIQNNENENDELKLRKLNEFKKDFIKENKDINPSSIEVENSKLSNNKKYNKRKLSNKGTYYGMKNIENEKILFKYNLIGLILEGIVISKIDVSNGMSTSYLKLTFGFINFKINLDKMQTNMHIITKNTQQMTYNMIGLLYNSSKELEKRNKIYSDIFIDLEKNVTHLLENYYDYSGLFRDSMEFLYDQVKNFTGEFFNELIDLIEKVYDNYTIILNQTENDEFEILNNIRNETKNEYINYINNMADNILIFKNDTLIFLNNILIEVDEIHDFQLDVLYDIIDVIYDGKFLKNLLKNYSRPWIKELRLLNMI